MNKVKVEDLEKFKPDWKHRRAAVYGVLGFMCFLLLLHIGLVGLIAITASFTMGMSIFFVTSQILAFTTIVAVIGSYIFGSKWSTDNFFNLIRDVAPNFEINTGLDGKPPQQPYNPYNYYQDQPYVPPPPAESQEPNDDDVKDSN